MSIIKKGKCKRCGFCCIISLDDDDNFTMDNPCKWLRWDENNLPYCELGEDRHEVCKAFPTIDTDKNIYKDCGYYFEEE